VGGVDGRVGGPCRRFERLRGAHVAGAGGDTEDEEARVAWHARILAEARAPVPMEGAGDRGPRRAAVGFLR
jgi:hypothetical protein